MERKTLNDLVKENDRYLKRPTQQLQPLVPIEQTHRDIAKQDTDKLNFWGNVRAATQAVAGATVQAGVRLTRQLGNQIEREITSTMSSPNKTIQQNALEYIDRFNQRASEYAGKIAEGEESKVSAIWKATRDSLIDLSKQFANETNTGIYALDTYTSFVRLPTNYFKGMVSQGETNFNNWLKPTEDAIGRWANLEAQSLGVQIVAGAFSSMPQSMMTRIGVAGIPIMLTTAYQSNMEQALADGRDITDKKVITNALWSASIEVGTEYAFGLFKGFAGAGKALKGATGLGAKKMIIAGTKGFLDNFFERTAKEAVKPTMRRLIAHIVRQGLEEGFEEELSLFGSAIVAKLTTDKEKSYFGELITWDDIALAGLSGALAGILLSGRRAYRDYANLAGAVQDFYETDIREITDEQYNKWYQAITKDVESPAVRERILRDLKKAEVFAAAEEGGAPQTETPTPPVSGAKTEPKTQTDSLSDEDKKYYASIGVTLGKDVFEEAGTPNQIANIRKVNEQIQTAAENYVKAMKNNSVAAPIYKNTIDKLREYGRLVENNANANPMNVTMEDIEVERVRKEYNIPRLGEKYADDKPKEATPAQATAQAPVTAQPTTQPHAPVTAPAGAPVASQPKAGATTRADYPTYLEWLIHQRDAALNRARKATGAQKNSILTKRVPEIEAKIAAEREAIKNGTTTEVIKAIKQPKKGKTKTTVQQATAPAPAPAPAPVAQPVTQTPAPQAPTKEEKPVVKGKAKAQPKQEAKQPVQEQPEEQKNAPALTKNAPSWLPKDSENYSSNAIVYSNARIRSVTDELIEKAKSRSPVELASDNDVKSYQLELATRFKEYWGIDTVFVKYSEVDEHGYIYDVSGHQYKKVVFLYTNESAASRPGSALVIISHEFIHTLFRDGRLSEYKKILFDEIGLTDALKNRIEEEKVKRRRSALSTAETLEIKMDVYRDFLRETVGDFISEHYTQPQLENELIAYYTQSLFSRQELWDKFYAKIGVKNESFYDKLVRWIKDAKGIISGIIPEDGKALDEFVNVLVKAREDYIASQPKVKPTTTAKTEPAPEPKAQAPPKKGKTKATTIDNLDPDSKRYIAIIRDKAGNVKHTKTYDDYKNKQALAEELRANGIPVLKVFSIAQLKDMLDNGIPKNKVLDNWYQYANQIIIPQMRESKGNEPVIVPAPETEPIAKPVPAPASEAKPATKGKTKTIKPKVTEAQKKAERFEGSFEFLSENRRIDADNVATLKTKEGNAAVLELFERIQQGVFSKKNTALMHIGFNWVDGDLIQDRTMLDKSDLNADTLAKMKYNAMLSFYKSIGLDKITKSMSLAYEMFRYSITTSPEQFAKIFNTSGKGADRVRDIHRKLYEYAYENGVFTALYLKHGKGKSIKESVMFYNPANDMTIYFSVADRESRDLKRWGLAPIYVAPIETASDIPVSIDAEGNEVTEAEQNKREAEQKKGKTKKQTIEDTVEAPKDVETATAKSLADVLRNAVTYPQAKLAVVENKDTNKYDLYPESYIDDERKVALQRAGAKYNSHTGIWRIDVVPNKSMDATLNKLIDAFKKIEEASVVIEAKATDAGIDAGIIDDSEMDRYINYKPDEQPSINKNALNNIRDSRIFKQPKDNETFWQKTRESIARYFARGGAPRLPRGKYARLRMLFLQNRAAGNIASSMSEMIISIYNQLDEPGEYIMAADYRTLRGIREDMLNPKNTGMINPWGYTTIAEVDAHINYIERLFNTPGGARVKYVVDEIGRAMDYIRKQYDKYTQVLGYSAQDVLFTHNYYMHHSIEDFDELIKTITASGSGLKKSWIGTKRTDPTARYLTDPAQADFMTMYQMFTDMKRMELLIEIKRFDISDEYKPGTKLPKGYVESNVNIVGVTYPEAAIKAHLGMIAEQQASILGIVGKAKERMIADAKKLELSTRLVIPEEIAKTGEELLGKQRGAMNNIITREIVRQWKAVMIKWPHRIFNYNVRNFFGDLDAMLATAPGAINFVPRAIVELHNFFTDKSVSNMMRGYIWMGGLNTGLSEVEMRNFQKMPSMKFYNELMGETDPRKITDKLSNMLGPHGTIEKMTQFREQILRYATYMYLMERGLDENNVPVQSFFGKKTTFYMASNRKEIQGLWSREEVAFKLSNDALGAYDDVSSFTSGLSDSFAPFFRFKEINIVRYFRVLANTFMSDNYVAGRAGANWVAKLGLTARVGASTLLRIGRLAIFGSLISLIALLMKRLWNLYDEENKYNLPDYVEETLHLYFGTMNGRSYYISGVGAVADLVDFLGIGQAVRDYQAMREGDMSFGDWVKNLVTAPFTDTIIQGYPIYKIIQESVTGQRSWPEPGPVRNKTEQLFNNLGFGHIYSLISDLPDEQLNPLQQIMRVLNIGSSVETEYTVYWHARDLVSRYVARNGGNADSGNAGNYTDKGNAIYYFKEAVRLGDKKSAELWMDKYILAGGNYDSYKRSMATLHPLQDIKKGERQKFYDSLEPDEQRTVDRAIALYEKIILDADDIAKSELGVAVDGVQEGFANGDLDMDDFVATLEDIFGVEDGGSK